MQRKELKDLARNIRLLRSKLTDHDVDIVATHLAEHIDARRGFYRSFRKDRFLSWCGMSWSSINKYEKDKDAKELPHVVHAVEKETPAPEEITKGLDEMSEYIKRAFT